jgi:hypothetical protein
MNAKPARKTKRNGSRPRPSKGEPQKRPSSKGLALDEQIAKIKATPVVDYAPCERLAAALQLDPEAIKDEWQSRVDGYAWDGMPRVQAETRAWQDLLGRLESRSCGERVDGGADLVRAGDTNAQ